MHEAMFYSKKEDGIVQCELCPHNCLIKEGRYGNCGVRKNVNGKLVSEVYGKPVSVAIDPIEKKPLFHFYPGTKILSFGTVGCNLHCKHCQNASTSQAKPDEFEIDFVSPKKLVELSVNNDCKSIAATYNEPTVFFEYMFETFKIANKKGIKTVAVSNGYINPEPLKKLLPLLDGVNIDLKAFTNDFYKEITSAKLKPVLESLKMINKSSTWLEITNLIIPTLNDALPSIKKMCKWIYEELGDSVPLHFSAFHPCYQLLDVPSTTVKMLEDAKKVALDVGIKYVYLGNVRVQEGETTFCSKCKEKLIVRDGFFVESDKVKGGKCRNCGEEIEGLF